MEDCRECRCDRYGEDGRGTLRDDEDSLDWKRRSKGRWAGLGLTRGEPRKASALLLCEEGTES
jgi:hypothetical protein